jgi:hypothetical protein
MIIRGNEPIVIIRRSEDGVDDYGNPTFTTSEILIRDGLFAVGTTNEPIDVERDAVDAAVTLYLPSGTVIEDGDVFEIRGTSWVKDGAAQVWDSPVGLDTGVIVNVRRRVG